MKKSDNSEAEDGYLESGYVHCLALRAERESLVTVPCWWVAVPYLGGMLPLQPIGRRPTVRAGDPRALGN